MNATRRQVVMNGRLSRARRMRHADRRTQPTSSSSAPATARASPTADGCPLARPRPCCRWCTGAAEHSSRYDRFAKLAVASGYAVYATDHRGHGRTRLRSGKTGDAGPDALKPHG